MTLSRVDKIAVIGGGIMGGGISQALLQNGYTVTIRDIDEDAIDDTHDRIKEGNYGLSRAVEGGHLSADEKDAVLQRLSFTQDIDEAVADADVVIEAVPEDLSLKGAVFRELNDTVPDGVPLYSNTSGFSIAAISNAVDDPSRVAGMHYFNPAQIMTLVEIVRTDQTDMEVVELGESLVDDIEKTSIVIDDSPGDYGFVANRAFGALRREAVKIVEEGVATEEQVDIALKEGYNLPVGPFEFAGIGEEWD